MRTIGLIKSAKEEATIKAEELVIEDNLVSLYAVREKMKQYKVAKAKRRESERKAEEIRNFKEQVKLCLKKLLANEEIQKKEAKIVLTRKLWQFKKELKKLTDWLIVKVRIKLNKFKRKYYKTRWKEKVIVLNARFKDDDELPKKKYPEIDKILCKMYWLKDNVPITKSDLPKEKYPEIDKFIELIKNELPRVRNPTIDKDKVEDELPRVRNPVIDKDKIEIQICRVQGKNQLDDNGKNFVLIYKFVLIKESKLPQNWNNCFSNYKLRFDRQLQSNGLPFTLQVEKLIENNKIMENKIFEVAGNNFWKPDLFVFRNEINSENLFKRRRSMLFEFQNEADCENLFKKRKTKFKMLNFLKETEMKDMKTVYLEMKDVVQFINYCKVCGNVKIKTQKSAIHMLWILIQIDKYKPRGWEFLIS
jgi:hypothetical protein